MVVVVLSGSGTMSDSISEPSTIDISLSSIAIVVGTEECVELETFLKSILVLNAFGSTTDADVKDVLDVIVVDLVDEVVVLVAVIDVVVVEVIIFFISSISSSVGISDDEVFIKSNALIVELSIKLSVNVLLKVEFLVFSLALEVFVVARVVAVFKIGSKVDNGFNAFSRENSSVLVIVVGLTDDVLVNADGVVVDINDVETLGVG